MGFVRELEKVAIDGVMPDLTIILDIDPKLGMRRADERRGHTSADRFEKESPAMQAKRRQAYLEIAEAEPDRCRVVDANRRADDVFGDITRLVRRYFADPSKLEMA
jgi:dTMP kinase